MNVKRFTAPNSRDALKQVRLAFGRDAVVLSTRPCADGVEVLAMAPDAMHEFERVAVPANPQPERPAWQEATAPAPARNVEKPGAWSRATAALRQRLDPTWDEDRTAAPAAQAVEDDVQTLSMSTLSFQDYVRERMLRRRKQELEAAQGTVGAANAPSAATEADPDTSQRSLSEAAMQPQSSPAARSASAARPAAPASVAAPQGVHVMPPAAADPQAVVARVGQRIGHKHGAQGRAADANRKHSCERPAGRRANLPRVNLSSEGLNVMDHLGDLTGDLRGRCERRIPQPVMPHHPLLVGIRNRPLLEGPHVVKRLLQPGPPLVDHRRRKGHAAEVETHPQGGNLGPQRGEAFPGIRGRVGHRSSPVIRGERKTATHAEAG